MRRVKDRRPDSAIAKESVTLAFFTMGPTLHALAITLALFAPAIAGNLQRHFESPITDSVWRTAGNALACRLVHEIPDYGKAVFTRRAGGGLDFHFDLNQPPGSSGNATIRVLPPPWKHDVAARDLGSVPFADRSAPFTLQGSRAIVLLASLEAGMEPTISYDAANVATDTVTVSISAVNFLDSLDDFHHCAAQLIPHTFEELRSSRLLFGPGSVALDEQAQGRLDQIASWMNLDRGVASAMIEGYTDTAGHRRENYLLSQQRALAVRDYLAAKGVGKKRMKVRFYGEERPLRGADGEPVGRENRRVEVRLYR